MIRKIRKSWAWSGKSHCKLQRKWERGRRERSKQTPELPRDFWGLHSCWDATGCPSTELNQRIQNFLLSEKIKGLCKAQDLADSQPHPRVHTNTLSSKFSTPIWLQTPQFLLQTWRFAYALGSSSNVPNCIKSLRRKTAPSLGIQKMKHKSLWPWESLSGAQVLPRGNSIRSLHLGALKLQQLRDTLSSTPVTAAWIAGQPKSIAHSLLATPLVLRAPQAGTLRPCWRPLADGMCQGVQAGAILSGKQLLAQLG